MKVPFSFLGSVFCFVLTVLGLRCFMGLALVEVSGRYSLVAVHGLLIAVASLVEHRLPNTSLIAVVHGPSCSSAYLIFPDRD